MATFVKTDIRKQVKKYIDSADDTTVKMVHAMLKVQKSEAMAEDKDEMDEIDLRIEEYEQGKIIPVTFEQIENSILTRFNQRNQSAK